MLMTVDQRPVDHCPFCNADLVGEPIPENIRHQYSPPWYWSRKIGVYGVKVDRTVRWQCPDCHGEWDRKGLEGPFGGEEPDL